ncbi:MAG: hypothetical protein PHY80_02045 [Rickettsiales bacterium]|nr:hypothetical protein [Rickettsiales bacterium]
MEVEKTSQTKKSEGVQQRRGQLTRTATFISGMGQTGAILKNKTHVEMVLNKDKNTSQSEQSR